MTTTAPRFTETAPDLADQLDELAADNLTRAKRIRRRSAGIDDPVLDPLRIAMQRRACELELAGSALLEIAGGQRRRTA